MLPVYHWYHCFADGAWEDPAREHVRALRGSGFCASYITVGLIGSADEVNFARDWFTSELTGMAPVGFIIAETGFEQVTLRVLHEWARHYAGEAAVLYAHTKGALSASLLNERWRQAMTADVVAGWRDCVALLGRYEAAGPYWMTTSGWPHGYFGGNFWWARASYLARLPELTRDMTGSMPPGELGDCRWDAETWIGLNDPYVRNLRPGPPR